MLFSEENENSAGVIKVIICDPINSGSNDDEDAKKILTCPYCGEKLVFYYRSPLVCDNSGCGQELPHITEMLREPDTRLKWHREERNKEKGV